MARFSAENRMILVLLYAVLALVMGGAAASVLRADPDARPRVTLDENTARLQAALDRQFPGIEQTFLALVESRDPETAREQALALASSLANRPDLFLSAFVPGTGAFYRDHALLFHDAADVRARVDQLLAMEPLYHAMAAAPDILGFAALVKEIGRAVEQGRSPPGLEAVLAAAAATTEAQVKGMARPVRWTVLAGLDGDVASQRWYVLAVPQPGAERQAAALARQASDGMQGVSWLWPRRALTATPSPMRDFVVPAALSVFLSLLLLAALLGSFRQTLAVMLACAVTLAATAAVAAAMGRPLDGATWSFALAVLAPVIVAGAMLAIAYGQCRARGLSAVQSVMLSAQRQGGLVSTAILLFAGVWVAWAVRQLPSLSQFAMIALVGCAVAWLLAMTLLPAAFALFSPMREEEPRHWLDETLDGPLSRHARNAMDVLAMLVLAAALFCAIFLPAMRFGERQLPSAPPPLLETPDSRGAVHILAPPGRVPDLVAGLAKLPEVGAIRTASQFLPPDAAPKVAELRRLRDLTPFDPVYRDPPEEDALRQAFADLEEQLATIASGPATSEALRDAALRLRRAVQLYASAAPPAAERVAELERALFASLGEASASARRLATLREPQVADLDPRLLARFVSPAGEWRIEVMPRNGVGQLSFAAALRRAVPESAGEPVVALVRNEMIHHETILALAAALVAAAVLLLAALRSIKAWVLSLAPAAALVTFTAAVTVSLGIWLNAAMLAGASAAVAVLIASSMMVAARLAGPEEFRKPQSRLPVRAALLAPVVLAGAVAPLAVSSRPAVAEFGAVLALLLVMAALLCVLIVPALARWLDRLSPGDEALFRSRRSPRQETEAVLASTTGVAARTNGKTRE
ncbi:hypothetical protein [Aestuariivirga sp.]|uniref:hypothetical protein n=1 Tax=Aestuariivirga sp. TaxID=2650926 RepID=UPI00391C6C3F